MYKFHRASKGVASCWKKDHQPVTWNGRNRSTATLALESYPIILLPVLVNVFHEQFTWNKGHKQLT
jgi:hypothetical protein